MTALLDPQRCIPAMSALAIDKVYAIEEKLFGCAQVQIETDHVLHAGMYARTITIPAGVFLTGALVRVPTVLIVSGHCAVYIGDTLREIQGYQVLAASGGRKQAFYAHRDTQITMVFPTRSETVAQAEDAFTDEAGCLMSRTQGAVNHIHITGEPACQEL